VPNYRQGQPRQHQQHQTAKPAGPAFATPAAPTGNAVLAIASGFPAQPDLPNPLCRVPLYTFARQFHNRAEEGRHADAIERVAHKAVARPARIETPDCQKYLQAISADSAAGLKADANGKTTLPGVPAGTYYLMVSTLYNNQPIYWDLRVELKEGANSLTLEQRNAAPFE